jgi:glycerophosphoryl diester phosphodiesterase
VTRRTEIPRIIGHRGAMGHAPENTLAGIRKAKDLGCDWVEVDLMLTADPVLILHHDETLERTTSGLGPVSETPLAEIREFDAGSWFSPEFVGARVPTFDETAAALRALNMGANLEIKPTKGYEVATGEAVGRRTAEIWPSDLPPPVLSSFSLEALEASMRVAPGLDRAILWEEVPKDWRDHHDRLGASAVHVGVRKLTEAQARAFTDAGVPFRSYTVNEPADAGRLFSWGCEAIFTDFPDRFL